MTTKPNIATIEWEAPEALLRAQGRRAVCEWIGIVIGTLMLSSGVVAAFVWFLDSLQVDRSLIPVRARVLLVAALTGCAILMGGLSVVASRSHRRVYSMSER